MKTPETELENGSNRHYDRDCCSLLIVRVMIGVGN